MGKIKISELSTINEYNNNDVLLVSRKENQTNTDEYITFNYKIDNFRNVISNDVYNALGKRLNDITSIIDTIYDNNVSSISLYVSSHIESCDIKHNALSNELLVFKNNLSVNVENFKNEINLSVEMLSNTLNNKFNDLIISVRNEHNAHLLAVTEIINNLCSYISEHYVTLNTDQRITGKKTFAQDIIGTAMSARWA